MSDIKIIKKFTLFSTKEWLQYFQYKLSPDREKELVENSEIDPFLKEALEAFSSQDVRPVAFQSFSTLIQQVESATGVSESNIAKSNSNYSSSASNFNKQYLLIGLASVLGLALLGFGIYYLINNTDIFTSSYDENPIEELSAESTVISPADNTPFEVLPNAQRVDSPTTYTPQSTTVNTVAVKKTEKNKASTTVYSQDDNVQPQSEVDKPSAPVKAAAPQSPQKNYAKERELFEKAQDLYKQGRNDESKAILKNLRSYDNPMRNQSETILNNIENQ